MRGAPHRRFAADTAYQGADVGRDEWTPVPVMALPRPEQAEALTMPGDDRGWLYDHECCPPLRPDAREPDPEEAVQPVLDAAAVDPIRRRRGVGAATRASSSRATREHTTAEAAKQGSMSW